MKQTRLLSAILSLSLLCTTSSCDEVIDSIFDEDDETEQTGNDSHQTNNNGDSDKSNLAPEVESAFNYLNSVRQNPSNYASKITHHLSNVNAIGKLTWNENLGKAAQMKAEDMAKRGYFGHVDPDGYGMNYYINSFGYNLSSDWISDKSSNFFESIAAGYGSGKSTVEQLIEDGGADNSSAGHRRHLLGIDDFYAGCYDIGIGMAYNPNSTYKYYWSFLIAKHSF